MDTVIQVISDEPVPPRRLNAVDPARPGDDLPEVPGEGAGAAVRLGGGPGRRPAAVPGGRADRGAAGDAARSGPSSGRGGGRRSPDWPRLWSRRWSWGSPGWPCSGAAPRTMRRLPGATKPRPGYRPRPRPRHTEAQKQAGIARLNERKAQESARTEAVAHDRGPEECGGRHREAEALRRQDYISRVNLAYRECLDNNVARATGTARGLPAGPAELGMAITPAASAISTCRPFASLQHAGQRRGLQPRRPAARHPDPGPSGRARGGGRSGGARRGDRRGSPRPSRAFGRCLRRGLQPRRPIGWPPARYDSGGVGCRTPAGNASASPVPAEPVNGLAFTPDSRRIIVAPGDAAASPVIPGLGCGDRRRGRPLPGHPGGVASVAVSPDGLQAALASIGRGRSLGPPGAQADPHAAGARRLRLRGGVQPRRPVCRHRGLRQDDPALGSVHRGRGPASFRLMRASSAAWRSAPTPGGSSRAAEDKSVKLWSVGSDRELATLHGHQHYVVSVAFSPDGHRIASGSVDHTARIWFATPTLQLTFRGHTGWVNTVAFSPDGHRVASGSGPYTSFNFLQVWDPGTGERLRTFPEERAPINALVFSPDGKTGHIR